MTTGDQSYYPYKRLEIVEQELEQKDLILAKTIMEGQKLVYKTWGEPIQQYIFVSITDENNNPTGGFYQQ